MAGSFRRVLWLLLVLSRRRCCWCCLVVVVVAVVGGVVSGWWLLLRGVHWLVMRYALRRESFASFLSQLALAPVTLWQKQRPLELE